MTRVNIVRHEALTAELRRRGFNLSYTTSEVFKDVPSGFYKPTSEALRLNMEHIADRMPKDPKYSLKKDKKVLKF